MEKLLEALEEKRGELPVVEFAPGLGVSPATYYRWLKGERSINIEALKNIIRTYPDLALVVMVELAKPEEEDADG